MKTTAPDQALSLRNGYALPDGRVLSFPSHCQAAVELFTLADHTVVSAVRVDNDKRSALESAAAIEVRRLALVAKLARR